MELMKNKNLFREHVVVSRDNAEEPQNADLPKTVDDVDRVNLGNVVVAA